MLVGRFPAAALIGAYASNCGKCSSWNQNSTLGWILQNQIAVSIELQGLFCAAHFFPIAHYSSVFALNRGGILGAAK